MYTADDDGAKLILYACIRNNIIITLPRRSDPLVSDVRHYKRRGKRRAGEARANNRQDAEAARRRTTCAFPMGGGVRDGEDDRNRFGRPNKSCVPRVKGTSKNGRGGDVRGR